MDAYLTAAVLAGASASAGLDWWWADPAAGLVIVYYGGLKAHHTLTHTPDAGGA